MRSFSYCGGAVMISAIGRSVFFFMMIVVGIGEFILGLPSWNCDSKDKLNLVLTLVVMGAFVVIGNILVYAVS